MSDVWQDWPPHPDPIDLATLFFVWQNPRRFFFARATAEVDIDDCTEVYADYPGDCAIFDLMDDDQSFGRDTEETCSSICGHQWMQDNSGVRCRFCLTPGMPVKASREAE